MERYFDQEAQKICSAFWEIIKETVKTQPTLTDPLINSFISCNIPLTNIIGFASDGCTAVESDNDPVKTRIIRDKTQ